MSTSPSQDISEPEKLEPQLRTSWLAGFALTWLVAASLSGLTQLLFHYQPLTIWVGLIVSGSGMLGFCGDAKISRIALWPEDVLNLSLGFLIDPQLGAWFFFTIVFILTSSFLIPEMIGAGCGWLGRKLCDKMGVTQPGTFPRSLLPRRFSILELFVFTGSIALILTIFDQLRGEHYPLPLVIAIFAGQLCGLLVAIGLFITAPPDEKPKSKGPL